MRFLANENLPRRSIELLRGLGYEIDSISEDSPGITDQQVIERAVKDGSIIVTFDRDLSKKEISLEGYFTTAEKDRVRQRKLKVQ